MTSEIIDVPRGIVRVPCPAEQRSNCLVKHRLDENERCCLGSVTVCPFALLPTT